MSKKVWLIGIFAILFVGYMGCYPYSTSFETIFTVTAKEIKQINGQDHQTYLIGTDNGSFKIEDNWAHWQFRSFDLYASIKQGTKYRGKAYGWRSGIFSSFPNLYYVEEVQE